MAGFFGFSNYTKEGPGVDKNQPKKRALFVFFEIYFRKFWKLCFASLLYALVSLPIVTGGLAEAGLAYVTRSYVRERHAFLPSDFFDTIRRNWKQALPAGIIHLILSVLLLFNLYFFAVVQNTAFAMIGLCLTLCLLVLVNFVYYYVYFLIVTFKLRLRQIFKNGMLLSSAAMGRNFLIFTILLLCYAFGALLIVSGPFAWLLAMVLYLFVFPAFRSFLIQFMVFQPIRKWMIDPYYEEHPDEDIELRRSLGLMDEQADETSEKPLFVDQGSAKPEEESVPLPRQYSEREMRSFRKQTQKKDADDDQI